MIQVTNRQARPQAGIAKVQKLQPSDAVRNEPTPLERGQLAEFVFQLRDLREVKLVT